MASPRTTWSSASTYTRGLIFVLIGSVGFGLLPVLSGFAYRAGMTPPAFTAARAFVGFVVLALVVWIPAREGFSLRATPRRQVLLLVVATGMNATTNLALFAAYGLMPVAVAMAAYFSYPLFVAGSSVALGRERVTAPRLLGLVMAIIGLGFIFLADLRGGSLSAAGLFFALIASGTQAGYLVIGRAGWPDVPSDRAITIVLGGGCLAAGTVALLLGQGEDLVGWMVSPAALISVLVAGTVSAAWAKVLILRGVRRIGGTRAAVISLTEPLTGVVLAALLLGQAVSLTVAIGGALVLAAAALVQRPASASGATLPDALQNLR